MAGVGDSAHTPHGIGQITEVDSVRGRRSFRVAGRNFNVWVDETSLHLASGDHHHHHDDREELDPTGLYDWDPNNVKPFDWSEHHSSLDATIEQGDVNHDNSTTLPYNPTPQHNVELFRSEQTIQPGEYDIDPDDRLHSSDSLTGNDKEPNRPYPGPNPDLFAKHSGLFHHDPLAAGVHGEEQGEWDSYRQGHPDDGGGASAEDQRQWADWQSKHRNAASDDHRGLWDSSEHGFKQHFDHLMGNDEHFLPPPGADMDEAMPVSGHAGGGGVEAQLYGYASKQAAFEDLDKDAPKWGEDRWHSDLPDGPDRTFGKDAAYHYAVGEEDDLMNQGAAGNMNPGKIPIAHPDGSVQGGINTINHMPALNIPGGTTPFAHMDASPRVSVYRPAGLSNRYAHFDIEAHDGMDPVSQFRRDPEGFLHTAGYIQSGDQDYLANKYAAYTSLLATDPQMHTASLQEMQEKAIRMARSGSVLVRDSSSHGVYASVTDPDDGNTYDTLLTKAGSWQCGCEWGRWAFHQGSVHMCPHAYAAYGSTRTADVVDRFKAWSNAQTDGHIDEASIDDFLNQDDQLAHHQDVDKLYKYVLNNPDEQKERKYDVDGYSLDPEKSYKEASQWDTATPEEEAHWAQMEKSQGQEFQHEHSPAMDQVPHPQRYADALRLRPKSLTPDLKVVPEGEDEKWVDVTKDDRETTGPDQIVHFSAIIAKLHGAQMEDNTDNGMAAQDADKEVGMPTPSSNLVASLHQADKFENGQDVTPQSGGGGLGNPFPAIGNFLGDQAHHFNQGLGQMGDALTWHPGKPNPFSDQQPQQQSPAPASPSGQPGGQADLTKMLLPGQQQPAGQSQTSQPGGFNPKGQQTGVGLLSDPSQSTLKPGQAEPSNYQEMVKNTVGEGNQGHNTGLGAGANGAMGTGSGYGGAGFQGNGGTGGNWLKSNETSGIHGDYTIKPGDTLNDIASRSGLSVQDIAKQNNISDINNINSGTQLKLPGATGGTPGADNASPGSTSAGGHGTAPVAKGSPADLSTPQEGDNVPVAQGGTQPKMPATPPVGGGTIPGGTQLADQTRTDTQNSAQSQPPKIQTPTPPSIPPLPGAGGGGGGQSRSGPQLPSAPQIPGTHASRRHFADQSDASLLDKLRDMSSDTPEDSLGHMDSRNDKLRDVIDELQDRGMDASFMVAHLIEADNPSDGNADFSGVSAPQDPDMDFAGSGPDPKTWFSDSGSYVDAKERPHHVDDWHEGDGDIIKFNDSRSAPPQGPRSASRYADFDTPPSMGGVEGMPANEYGTGPEDSMGQGQSMVSSLHRVGGGPRQAVRVDPGFRGHQAPRHASAPPEDFGYDGDIAPPSGGNEATDIVAAFQRSGAAEGIFGQQASSNDDIAGAAQHFLRTAGRKFTPDEQRVLEAENHPLGARNLPTDEELSGTHYLLGL